MALSSDEIIKREIIDHVGPIVGNFYARVFNEGSNDDQRLFSEGGLTFTHNGQDYGSCDCVYVKEDNNSNEIAVLAIEGTDCLGRGSSGNAQYQRFHHALGAVKQGVIGIYYLRAGKHKVQPDLYGMAYNASQKFGTPYLIVQELSVIKKILELMGSDLQQLEKYINDYQQKCYSIYLDKFNTLYKGDWNIFAKKRSTIIFNDHIVKYSSRNIRNFTDGSQRAGHIAVGEMFLSRYFFPEKELFYLWPRITTDEVLTLDRTKGHDKEWSLLRNEPGVIIKTLDDIEDIPENLKNYFFESRLKPITGENIKMWNTASIELHKLIETGKVTVR